MSSDQMPQILTLPLLNIAPKADASLRPQIQSSLAIADLIIFVSPNAVECTMDLLDQPWHEVLNRNTPIGVMGGSSQAALEQYGIGSQDGLSKIILPRDNAHWDSEGLWNELQKLAWDWKAKKVIIFKGEGGRDWLANTLQNAGAQVELISVYSRAPLNFKDPAWLAVQGIDFSQSLWLLTSSEAVRYLGQAKLPVDAAMAICPHHRISDAAEQIGFREVFTCEPGDDALVAATQAWLQI
jgi:uroporphyrinogen-III synthase